MQILSRINWVDIVVLILMVRISYVAFMDGLSHEIFPFFGTVAVFILSLHYYTGLGEAISQNLGNMPAEVSNCLAFIILVVTLGFIIKFIKIILDKMVKVQWHPVIEKFGGLFVGILKAYVIIAMIVTILALIPLSYLQWSVKERSLTGKYILMAGPEIHGKAKVFLSDNSTIPKKAPPKK
ncbi:MAG: CvpA family protein [Candidatus Omnitrophota bacterium]|nr:CvpA family protein [Candidatus Omnitrophota bacterium]